MASRPTELPSFLAALGQALERRRFPFMLIGGQAVLVHGVPRLTEDIDVTLGADPTRLPDLLEACSDLELDPLPADIPRFVSETFVLPARHQPSGLRVDFVFSTTPYERQAIERAVRVEVAGSSVPVATAEDLLIHKLFAGRPRDMEDAAGIVRRKAGNLDWSYVERWVSEFQEVPGRADLAQRLARLRADEA